ncbi:hypothetical protein F1880_002354 [Penicillium rolfsii]|nr:hypothetical protein F1880_002354 [Penicillium rolfsii]
MDLTYRKYRFTTGKKNKMSRDVTSDTLGGVEPGFTPMSTASLTKTEPSHEREQSISREKKERRREQVRLAQRAYRARNEANTIALKQRIAQLESALEAQSKAVVLLSNLLEEDPVVMSHPHIADRLRETVKICLNSAMYSEESTTSGTWRVYTIQNNVSVGGPTNSEHHRSQGECVELNSRYVEHGGVIRISMTNFNPAKLLAFEVEDWVIPYSGQLESLRDSVPRKQEKPSPIENFRLRWFFHV